MGEVDERLSPIEGDAAISIPREVFGSLGSEGQVRMASFLFRNMSGLLPESLEGVENNRWVYSNWYRMVRKDSGTWCIDTIDEPILICAVARFVDFFHHMWTCFRTVGMMHKL